FVQPLLERQVDVEADALASRINRPAVRRLHDAGPAAGADHEAMVRKIEGEGPFREQEGQLSRILIKPGTVDSPPGALHCLAERGLLAIFAIADFRIFSVLTIFGA